MNKQNPTKEDRALTIGFVGQGFIGKNMADDFERRKFRVIRYALEEPYIQNRDAVRKSDIVFVAVPTPTCNMSFDDSVLHKVLRIFQKGTAVVIKSTILPGTTNRLQNEYPHLKILHSPEFLTEKTAKEDAEHPPRNIVGIPKNTKRYKDVAKLVLRILPDAPYVSICTANEAEIIKYGGNIFLMMKVVYMNTLYDLANEVGADYELVAEAIAKDERIGNSHMNVKDVSGHKGAKKGRGAGGHCLPKDLAALISFYKENVDDYYGQKFLEAIAAKNNSLLCADGKDADLLFEVYGEKQLQRYKK